MYQISNEKFGLFVTELRKEKNLTQKQCHYPGPTKPHFSKSIATPPFIWLFGNLPTFCRLAPL